MLSPDQAEEERAGEQARLTIKQRERCNWSRAEAQTTSAAVSVLACYYPTGLFRPLLETYQLDCFSLVLTFWLV